jgi:hypothetical protein
LFPRRIIVDCEDSTLCGFDLPIVKGGILSVVNKGYKQRCVTVVSVVHNASY